MTYELWVGRTLYLSTRSMTDAFNLFKRFTKNGKAARINFIQDRIVEAA